MIPLRIPTRDRLAFTGLALGLSMTLTTTRAFASGAGMPWEQPLQQVLDSVQGPVAKIVAVIIIIVTGLDATGGYAVADLTPVTTPANPVTSEGD